MAFDKLDGSNMRFEYSHKRGFYKFGTRNVMIDSGNEQFGFAVDLFLQKYADQLAKVFSAREYRNSQSFVCFAELVGTRSAFGQHDFDKDTFDIVLFDVNEHKRGFVPPKRFVDDFGHCGIPRVVYNGKLNMQFINDVKANKFGLSEGVIGKGVVSGKKDRTSLYYFKAKTDDWFDRLRIRDRDAYAKELDQANKTKRQ